jgi:hypothetical protein
MRGERDGTPAALPRRGQHQGERRSLRVAMPDGRAARREERAVHREERATDRKARAVHREERATDRKARAGRSKEGAMHRAEWAALVYARVLPLSLRRAMPAALA